MGLQTVTQLKMSVEKRQRIVYFLFFFKVFIVVISRRFRGVLKCSSGGFHILSPVANSPEAGGGRRSAAAACTAPACSDRPARALSASSRCDRSSARGRSGILSCRQQRTHSSAFTLTFKYKVAQEKGKFQRGVGTDLWCVN